MAAVAGELHAQVELVGVEVRDVVVHGRPAHHDARRDRLPPQRVRPVLAAQAPPDRRGGRRWRRRRPRRRRARWCAAMRRQDAVVDVEAGRLGQRGVRDGADADQDEVGGHLRRRPRRRSRDRLAPRAAGPARSCAGRRRCARAAGEHPAHAGAHRRGERHGIALEDRHVVAEVLAVAATSMPIQPEPMSTSRRPPPRSCAAGVRVVQGAQGVHAVEVGRGAAAAGRGAGRQQHRVVGELPRRR